MTNLLNKQIIIICLDQYCTSNMYDGIESVHWVDIRNLLLEAYNKNKIICPIPFEHFLETSQKNYDSGVNIIKKFSDISGGYRYEFELFITSQLMISFLRKSNKALNTYLVKHNELIFLKEENYNRTKSFKKEFDITFNQALESQNLIRNATRNSKVEHKMDIFLK